MWALMYASTAVHSGRCAGPSRVQRMDSTSLGHREHHQGEKSMGTWRDRRILDLFGIEAPIVLGPMAGPGTPELAIAVCEAGGLGSLPCALLSVEQARDGIALIRSKTRAPLNINFFCHVPPQADVSRIMAWRARLAEYYIEYGLDPEVTPPAAGRRPVGRAEVAGERGTACRGRRY